MSKVARPQVEWRRCLVAERNAMTSPRLQLRKVWSVAASSASMPRR